MQIDWSAKRTCSEFASAVEWTATVSTPSSRAARITRSAISPRFAMRMRWNMGTPSHTRTREKSRSNVGLSCLRRPGLDKLESKERLSVLDRATVLHQHVDEAAGLLRFDLVHQLHRLDDAEHLAFLDHLPDVHEGRAVGRGGAVERADERRIDGEGLVVPGGRRSLGLR